MKMKKRHNFVKRERRLKCPACGKALEEARTPGPSPSERLAFIAARSGDLTQCGHCAAVLEYCENPAGLTLRVAPPERVEQINQVIPYRQPTLSQTIEFVRKTRQMPQLSISEHRFRLGGKRDRPSRDEE